MEIWENENYILTEMQGTKVIINNITRGITRYAQEQNNDGVKLLGWQCVILQFPNGLEEFALYNQKGQPIALSPRLQEIGTRIDIEKTKVLNKETVKCRV